MAQRRGFGRIRKRPSGRFQVGYTGPDGDVHYAPMTFTARTDAEGWLRDERRRIESGDWTPPGDVEQRRREQGATFGEYAGAWLADRKLKPKTVHHYRRLLDARILPEFQDVPLKRLTKPRVQAWLNAQGNRTPTMTAHGYALLRTILNTAVEDGLIAESPCTIRDAGHTRRAKRIEPASLDELAAIVSEMPERHRLAVLLAAWCALRFGEIAELRRGDVDQKHLRLNIRRGVVTVDGERIVGTPKTEAGIRQVAIPPHLAPLIQRHLAEHAQPGRTGLLFPGRDGRQIAYTSFMGKPARRRVVKGYLIDEGASGFIRAREAAGRPDLRFHDLRHTGAVLAAQAGATLAELMLRLGHTTPAAAMIYQHAARDRDAEIARRLSDMAEGEG